MISLTIQEEAEVTTTTGHLVDGGEDPTTTTTIGQRGDVTTATTATTTTATATATATPIATTTATATIPIASLHQAMTLLQHQDRLHFRPMNLLVFLILNPIQGLQILNLKQILNPLNSPILTNILIKIVKISSSNLSLRI